VPAGAGHNFRRGLSDESHRKEPAAVLLLLALDAVFAPAPSHGQGGLSPLVPPQSNAFGKSFEEWNVLQTQRLLEVGFGGTNPSDTVRGVRLLPGDVVNKTPVFQITLPPGTPFVASPFFVFGERYDNAPDDDPVALKPVLDEIFATAEIQIVLDGQVLLEGSGTDLKRFRFGPVFLDQPVVYAQPQPRGENLNALAALWVMGIGAVYHPLPIGEHTLVYTVHSEAFGDFLFTYHITVSPR
jgi:hypothetical protein